MEKQKVYKVFSRYTQKGSSDTGQINIIKSDSVIEIRRQNADSNVKSLTRTSTRRTQIMYFDTQPEAKAWEQRLDSIVDDILIDLSIDSLYSNSNFRQGDIDSNIKEALAQNGIYTPFEYAVKGAGGEIISQSENFSPKTINSTYKTPIYPHSVAPHKEELLVQIPQAGKNRKMWTSSLPVIIHSVVFILFIAITFLVIIRTLLKQKKISIIKNDFINNMTHEFKTPIATISLAADALKSENPTPEQNTHFANIIKQESRNMNQKVETILQMALVEQQQVQLHKETIGANALVQKVLQHFQLRFENSGATIATQYLDNDAYLYVDAHHMSNVLGNIVDNALKYAQNEPQIKITLSATQNALHISIADRGVGMGKDEQKHAFDKFYRAQSGNIHNTKGFGLGLSYAREIVLLHKGQIAIESEKGQGTTVTIILPINHGNKG